VFQPRPETFDPVSDPTRRRDPVDEFSKHKYLDGLIGLGSNNVSDTYL